MKTVKIIGLIIIVAIGCILIGLGRARHEAAREAELQRMKVQRAAELERAGKQALAPPAPVDLTATEQAAIPPSTEPKVVSPLAPSPGLKLVLTKQAGAAQASPKPAPRKKEWQDPEARAALSFVGAVPEADLYWYFAINDPNLPANERQDLIEDLNEEGFADPKNLTADDLPLILNRLEIIEELAPDALDKVNADAFQEAYKDLVNMAARLVRE